MRAHRIDKSTPELDKLENDWWNDNAQTIEKIWAQSFEIQQMIRLPYLKKAKAFFQTGANKSLIWEVGCGTGWVCRMIADDQLHVVGTDFSKAQIDLANASAATFGKEKFCTYLLADASTRVEGHSGILIQAILHHLSKEELDVFFKLIAEQKSGTKVFLFEPVFIQAKSNRGFLLALAFKQVLKLYRTMALWLIKMLGKKDVALMEKVNNLFVQAEAKGWFLSPKEVPFYEDELNTYLDRYFKVERSYFVNKSELDIAQNLVFYNMPAPGKLFSKFIMPMAIKLDRIFFSLNFRSTTKGQYFFKCFELTVK